MNPILLILLIFLICGVYPAWNYGGQYAGGGLATVILILVILLLLGKI